MLHAPGGFGKSYILTKLKETFGDQLVLSATTGSAAVGIAGQTLHSVIPGFMSGAYKKLCTRSHFAKKFLAMQFLVIDEISMLTAELFETLDRVVREVYAILSRKHHVVYNTALPFAGLQLIISGDFLQIPPINGAYVYESPLFGQLNFQNVPLTVPYRFTDPDYAALLDRIRVGEHTRDDIATLYTRRTTIADIRDTPIIKMLAKHAQVLAINTKELAKLDAPRFSHTATDVGDCTVLDDIIPRVLEYCQGARVMLRVNMADIGLSNGDTGIITKCTPGMIEIQFDRGGTHIIGPTKVKRRAGNVNISRTQFPINIAFAITIHKSQGMTFDAIVVDMRDIFGTGMTYVALSRVRSLAGLHIVNFDASRITVNRAVLAAIRSW